jgi:hypothetical protein
VVATATANADLNKIYALIGTHDTLCGGGGCGTKKETTGRRGGQRNSPGILKVIIQ